MKSSLISPTLRDIFRLAFSTPFVWLAGDPNARPNLNWAVTEAEEIQEGDVLLLNSISNARRIVQRAQERGAAVVVFVGEGSPPENILPTGLPIVALPTQQHLQAVQRSLLAVLVNQRAALMERGVRIHAQLAQIEAEGHGLVGLAAAMADISGHGVAVQDKRLNILASQPSPALKSRWREILTSLENPDLLPASLRDRKLAALHAATIQQPLSGSLVRLLAPIIVGGMARGYLSLISPADELTALDSLVVEQGVLVCGVEMSRTKAVREAEKRLKGDLLNALLRENISPQDAELWAQSMGLDLTQAHVAMRFSWLGASPPSRRRLETLVHGEITRLNLNVIVSPLGTEIVCFCEVPRGLPRPEIALRFAEAVIEQGKKEYPEALILCGLGTPCYNLAEWRSSFRQAGQALELARRFRESRPLLFPDLPVYRLLLQLEHDPELMAFQEEMLGPLLGSEGGRELIHTLEAYFEYNCNLSQAAEALFIHRNTLIYRLDRISQITALNLDDSEIRLALHLALHIYRMLEKGSSRPSS